MFFPFSSFGSVLASPSEWIEPPAKRAVVTALFLGVCAAIAGSGCAGWSESRGTVPEPEKKDLRVKISTRREGDATRVFVENQELCEVTMTFEFALVNLTGVAPSYTATFPAGEVTEAFVLSPKDPDQKWEFSYTNYFKLGSNCIEHDDSYRYLLPYAPGKKYKVTQSFGGSFSHKGSNKYAVDWKMPEGTPVLAARGGTVVKIKQDSNTGGASLDYDKFNNYVLIRHDDGTLGHYCHLQQQSVSVMPGQKVSAGDMLGRSGNTGFSSGPHLHFCVFRTVNGRERESVPISFKTAEGDAITLASGRSYRAVGASEEPKTQVTQVSAERKQ